MVAQQALDPPAKTLRQANDVRLFGQSRHSFASQLFKHVMPDLPTE